ncbi:MAG: sigma factor, partial [Chitinophagaceae bacterium]
MKVQIKSEYEGNALSMANAQTFDELYRAYFAPLCYFATNLLNSDDDAKDLVEDLFLKLWQRR